MDPNDLGTHPFARSSPSSPSNIRTGSPESPGSTLHLFATFITLFFTSSTAPLLLLTSTTKHILRSLLDLDT
ncbi:hypothetical protein EV360DRAFT_90301 [Lentinula raphanica]|nr:hypothetical protein EV360DRAFT_90301 [Lentinula raphanica]